MEAVARQLILTRHRSVPQNERSMNKYSCGNDPQPGDVVEVVTMEDLPEESWWNQAITEKLQKEKHYSVFAVAFGDWICLFNKPEIIWHHPSRFRLIRRAGEQPQPDMAKLIEEKVNKILPAFACLVNLDLNDARQMILTIRAFEYANADTYTLEPKTREESVKNEIFFTKASCYWKRKMLSIYDVKQIQAIQKHEHWEVARLKSRLPIERW